jgi:hypothetical protein
MYHNTYWIAPVNRVEMFWLFLGMKVNTENAIIPRDREPKTRSREYGFESHLG